MLPPISISGAASAVQRNAALPAAGPPARQGDDAAAPRFQELLFRSIEQVSELDRQSQGEIAGLLTGDDLTQAEVFTAVKKADLAFRTMLQIRNKLVEAYNEVKNMRM